jgi:hypothetical protein
MTQALSPPRPLAIRAPQAAAHALPHPVHLTGLRHNNRALDAAPLIVERRDQDFIEGLLADLADRERHATLLASTPALQNQRMRLFQPMQRVFNLLVLEAFCDVPGQPRLDPQKIDSAGFVLRRVADDGRKLAWLKAGTQVFGWEAVDEDLDPACDRRAPAVSLGHPALDARAPSLQRVRSAGSVRLAAAKKPVSEEVQPLFTAAPDVCEAAGKTVLFGTVRVASSELAEAGAQPVSFGRDADERAQLRDHLVTMLRAGSARNLPLAGRSFTSEDALAAARQPQLPARSGPPLTRTEFDVLQAQFVPVLHQLQTEFDAFGSSGGARALQQQLTLLQVETDVPASNGQAARVDTRSAYSFLLEAKAVLLDATPGARLTMPNRWGAVSSAIADAIFNATLSCLSEQHAKLLPAAGRFEPTRRNVEPRYVLRAFIRLKPEHAGCQGRLLWSAYSSEFTIAAWYESSGAAVPVIPMPDLFDRNELKKVKPNVAFAMPPKLAKLLQGDAKKLSEGEGDAGEGLGLGWICSFSLPIITLCAFIVLNIFLSLLNLIFFWLPMLKICIPIPKSKD